jgi:tetratricopeptide (TPR) repeat protein
MVAETEPLKIANRRMILRDSAAFAVLLCATVVLFAITLFLFRSFTARRAELAEYWSSIGSDDLQSQNPEAAIAALRTALVYAPGARPYELLLAQALGESNCAGCRDESYNYYMSLWESSPGDGSINLALARIARQRNDRQNAINFYRASIYGTWEGNGVDRRAAVRLELAGYLIETQNFSSARLELLTAGTNAPDNFDRNMTIASMLEKAGDRTDAFAYYQKAIADRPTDPTALDAAGRLAYESGDFAAAHRLLALEDRGESSLDPQAETLMEDARRIVDLTPSATLPPHERIERILTDRSIARKRFDSCAAHFAGARPEEIDSLDQRWSGADGTANAEALLHDPSLQASAMQLAFDTEVDTAQICTAAAGDDALLLRLATSPHHTPEAAEGTSQFAGPID